MRNTIGLLLANRAALGPTMEALAEVERERRFTVAGVHARIADELPRNPAGKISKRGLRERFPTPAAE